MKQDNKKSVLFLCTENSARSQMAEALLKNKAQDLFEVYSAGMHPTTIDKRTIKALTQYGIATEGLTSKHVDQFSNQQFDYVITLCDTAASECRDYKHTAMQLAWDCIDPKQRAGNDPFYDTLNEINNRLELFLSVEVHPEKLVDNNHSSENLDVIAFYKSLTDDIRLKTLMLTHFHGELCVCELMQIMAVDCQPKISRNLAVLKRNKILIARKHGQWVFYRINPELPVWAKSVIAVTTENNAYLIKDELQRLAHLENKPNRASFCK